MTWRRIFHFLLCLFIVSALPAQEKALNRLLSDSAMSGASVSFILTDAVTCETLTEFRSRTGLVPASVMKLVTTSAALEILGPDYRFKTIAGISGTFNRERGILSGDIIIKGGGDPSLGSSRQGTDTSFIDDWVKATVNYGIKKVKGRVIADDSRYDYEPVPSVWLWEDIGNYYGAGVYGLSVFENTLKIHFRTAERGSKPVILKFDPPATGITYSNFLTAYGASDRGYVFCPPYSDRGWLSGTIPEMRGDFVLKASIPDPPLLLAKTVHEKLKETGINVSGKPGTTRQLDGILNDTLIILSEVYSPPLKNLIGIINQESVNLYAEHLVKELGLVIKGEGSFRAGNGVIREFLEGKGISGAGIRIYDGSGLSPVNRLTAEMISSLLFYMKNRSPHSDIFLKSLPEAGREGTLKNVFTDPVFEGRLRAKSGSMAGVRNYAGYLITESGRELIFCILVNNFSGSTGHITSLIEDILKEVVLSR